MTELIQTLQKRAENCAVVAAAFAESGRIGWARRWAEKSDGFWLQWANALEALGF